MKSPTLHHHARMLVFTLTLAGPALAYTPLPDAGVTLSGHVDYMDYREHDDQGNRLLRESGYLRGFSLGLGHDFPWLTVGAFVSRSDGRVNYDGQTQAGIALQTTTDQGMTRYGIALHGLPLRVSEFEVGPYASVSYHLWNRVIEPTDTRFGLTENYRWWIATAGLRACGQYGALESCFRAGLARTFSGTMTINLARRGGGHPELTMEDSGGGEVAITAVRGRLFAEIYYQQWAFQKGDTVRRRVGNLLLDIVEPDNKTRIAGLAAGVRF